jgi:ubiquinone/menaquinone biosynthesis C-methylase UbiE
MRKDITENKIQSWFNREYQRRGVRSMRPSRAYDQFIELLQVKSGCRLLDIGCGPGQVLQSAVKSGLSTIGVDLSIEALKLAKYISPKSGLILTSAGNLPFPDQYFDYITLIGVLEHFTEMEKSILEIQRVAKNDALFCIMVPNSRTLYWQILEKFHYGDNQGNENAYPLNYWKDLFIESNFRILDLKRDKWRMKKISGIIQRNGSFSSGMQKLIEKIIPIQFAHQFIFLLTEAPVAGK